MISASTTHPIANAMKFIFLLPNNKSYHRECIRQVVVRSGEHGVTLLANKRIQPRQDRAVCHHLLNRNYSPLF